MLEGNQTRHYSTSTDKVNPKTLRNDIEEVIRFKNLQTSKRQYNLLLQAVFKQEDASFFSQCVKDYQAKGLDISTNNYNCMLFTLSKQEKLQEMLDLFDEMLLQQSVNARSFNTVLAACNRARDLPKALEIFSQMKNTSDFSYGMVISCCANVGDMKQADKLWKQLVQDGIKPSSHTCGSLMKLYAIKPGCSKKALKLFEDMTSLYGIKPHISTVASLVGSLLTDQRLDDALFFVKHQAMEQKFPLDVGIYNLLIDACRKEERWKEAMSLGTRLLRDPSISQSSNMEKDVQINLLPSKETKDLLDLIRRQDTTKILEKSIEKSQKDLKRKQIKREIQKMDQINSIIDEEDLKKHLKNVLKHGTKEQFDLFWHKKTSQKAKKWLTKDEYNRILFFIGQKGGHLSESREILDKMIQKGLADTQSFNTILSSCGRSSQNSLHGLYHAIQLVDKMKQLDILPNQKTLNLFLRCFQANPHTKWSQLEGIFHEMVHLYHIQPDTVTVNTLLTLLSQQKDQNEMARKAFELIEQSVNTYQIELTAQSFFLFFRCLTISICQYKSEEKEKEEDNDDDDANQLEDMILHICTEKSHTWKNDIGVWNSAMEFFATSKNWQGAFNLYQIMDAQGIQPNDTTLEFLLTCCCPSNNTMDEETNHREEQVEIGLSFINHLKQTKGYIPSSRIQKSIIRLHALSGQIDQAKAIIVDDDNNQKESYLQVLHGYTINGDPKGAINFLNDHLEIFQQDQELFLQANNRILRACRIARDPLTAVEFLCRSTSTKNASGQQQPMAFDLISFNTVFSTLRDLNLDYTPHLHLHPHPHAHAHPHPPQEEKEKEKQQKKDRVDMLFKVLNLMEEKQKQNQNQNQKNDQIIQPDLRTFAFILNALSNYQEHQLVLEYFDQFLPEIIDQVSTSPLNTSTSSFSSKYLYRILATYMNTCGQLEKTDRLMALWSEMFEKQHDFFLNYQKTTKIISRLLYTLKSIQKPNEALICFRDWMLRTKSNPNVDLYNQMMDICHTFDQIKYVIQLFETLHACKKSQPNSTSYIQVILAYEKMENWPQAMHFFMEMKQKNPLMLVNDPLELQKIALGRYELKQHMLH